MANIGVVLGGCAGKGPYEFGCLRAIEERFGRESIKCISSASMGALVGHAYGHRKIEQFAQFWKNIDTQEHGKFFLMYSGNDKILKGVCETLSTDEPLPFEHYVSAWNYTKRRVDYIPFHNLSGDLLMQYMRGVIAIPLFSGGEIINGDRILDGAFLDNIPAYPLLDKDLDYIFCIYFDNCNYFFENAEFNRKVIKIFDFPNKKRLEMMAFNPDNFDDMEQYGYELTQKIIDEVFVSEKKEDVWAAVERRDKSRDQTYSKRLTADMVLNQINVMTKRYSKRLSTRIKTED